MPPTTMTVRAVSSVECGVWFRRDVKRVDDGYRTHTRASIQMYLQSYLVKKIIFNRGTDEVLSIFPGRTNSANPLPRPATDDLKICLSSKETRVRFNYIF